MKRIKVICVFVLLCWHSASLAQHYNRYCNSVVPFCLDLPGNFSRAGTSDKGDGHFFTDKDGSTLSVYATFNTEKETMQQRFNREQTALSSDTTIANFTQMPTSGLAETQENSFTIAYQNGSFNYLIFRKLEDDNWINLELKYPTAKAKEYEAKAKRMFSSIK